MQKIVRYFGELSLSQLQKLSQLEELYLHWNQRINVISRKDMDQLYLHHVLHSLSIARVIAFRDGTSVIDAGTGGGLPGIPLAIMFPKVSFTLVDSVAKKIRVVESIIGELKLNNCVTRTTRLEKLGDRADFVVSRAVTDMDTLFRWVRKNIIPGGFNDLTNGLLALKGGDLKEELQKFSPGVRVFNLGEYFVEEYFSMKKVVYIPADV